MGCGIGGIIPKDVIDEETAIMAVRLTQSLERFGGDAWGYFDGEVLFKEPGKFVSSRLYNELPDRIIGKELYLCHSRYATQGDPNVNKNNHPFKLGSFVMSHNGILYKYDDFPNPEGVETDSYALLYWINYEYMKSRDVVKAIRDGVRHVRGSYAVWLYCLDNKRTYLFGVQESVLRLVFRFDDDKLVFASDVLAIADTYGVPMMELVSEGEAKLARPRVIYEVHKGKVKKVGSFVPNPVYLTDKVVFLKHYGSFGIYHVIDRLLQEV